MAGFRLYHKEQGHSPESPPPPSIAFLIIKKNSCYYDDLNATGIFDILANPPKADNGFPRKSAYPLHYHHIKGTFPIDYSKPYFEFCV